MFGQFQRWICRKKDSSLSRINLSFFSERSHKEMNRNLEDLFLRRRFSAFLSFFFPSFAKKYGLASYFCLSPEDWQKHMIWKNFSFLTLSQNRWFRYLNDMAIKKVLFPHFLLFSHDFKFHTNTQHTHTHIHTKHAYTHSHSISLSLTHTHTHTYTHMYTLIH